MNNNVVKFNNITKKFGKLIANKNIDFSVEKNEIHALLGENGAGKSTLMSILFGLYTPSSGSIEINGKEVKINSPKHANELKIAMLPQHFKLVENMSVLENIMLGYESLPNNNIKKVRKDLKVKLKDVDTQLASLEEGTKKEKLTGKRNELLSLIKENKTSKSTALGFIDKKSAREKIIFAKEKYKIDIDLKAKVSSLDVSNKQKVELLKILWGEADILIFDEPTSILTPNEITQFLKLLLDLKKAGKTILLITHKLPEIKAVSDRVSIIRKGEYIKTVSTKDTSEKQLANLMVGKEVDLNLSSIKRIQVNKEINVVKIENLKYEGKGYKKSINGASFEIKSGEILGIAAIDGNGQSELMKLISGLENPSSGKISISEHDVTNKTPRQHYYTREEYSNIDSLLRIKKIHQKFLSDTDKKVRKINKFKKEKQFEIANETIANYSEMAYYWAKNTSLLSHIPEDRHEHGLILDYSVTKNVILQDIKYFSNNFGIISNKFSKLRLDYIKNKYDVRGIQNYKTKARTLSGGNQQKLILGREIERGSNLLLAVHPTRGLDVGAIRNIYTNIIDARNQGSAVLLSSGELDEIMQVSDRIMVMYEGNIVSITPSGELSKLQLGSLMATGHLTSGIKQEKKLELTKKIQIKKVATKKTPDKAPAVKKAVVKKVTIKKIKEVKDNPKFVYKAKDGKWVIANSKNGKALRKAATQKEALALAGTFKDVTHVYVKSGNTWRAPKGAQVKAANATRLSAADKKVKGGK